jgi:hypothetical protein
MQRAAPQQHGTTVELVCFSSKTWFIIETRPINTAGRHVCIDPDDVRMCLGKVMCLERAKLEATLNCNSFKQSIQSQSHGKISID